MKAYLKITLYSMGCLALFCVGYLYWIFQQGKESTDDAYVTANIVTISPRVTGHVNTVLIKHNQHVRQGDVLFKLDSVPFEVAIHKAQQQLLHDQVTLENALIDNQRMQTLNTHHYVAAQKADQYQTRVKQLRAQIHLDKLDIKSKQLDLSYSTVKAPVSGWVTNLHLVRGDEVSANEPLFSIVDDKGTWIVANFKETQAEHIRPGQLVRITNDMYSAYYYKGVVESMSDGTGNAFALIPAENATGNWVKVVQRIPVRIRVLQQKNKPRLRVGTSSVVTVLTGRSS